MHSISVAELALWRRAAFAHTLLDVRRDIKRAGDGDEITGGSWLNPALWLDWKDTLADNEQPIVVYCAYGHEISQGLAAALRAMGRDARTLEGGIDAWRTAGHEVAAISA
ncbi:rhodanese-like domain-containing protein [Chitinimonas sp.]|uniref:rhodanese-like domain-containing protein n=1 Tax=Chitinimonas sp. TaxID=1934313 RepID=UPI0035B1A951